MRWSSGTKQSCRKSSAVGIARWPSFAIGGPTVNPSASLSITKAVTPRERVPGATVANTMKYSAMGAFEIQVFWPFST
jgi:hypothetical protein